MAVRYPKQENKRPPADSTDQTILSTIRGWQEDSEGFVSTWEGNQEKWHKMRMRIKKKKNFPFVG